MPIDTAVGDYVHTAGRGEVEVPVSPWESFSASFGEANVISQAIDFFGRPSRANRPPLDFSPFREIAGTPYEGFEDAFADVRSREEFEYVKRRVDGQLRAASLARQNPWSAMAGGFTGSVIDPTLLLPFGAVAKGGRAATTVGRFALLGATEGVLTESAFQIVDPLRTERESLQNVAGSTVIGGLIGGGVSFMSARRLAAMERRMARDLAGVDSLPEDIAGKLPDNFAQLDEGRQLQELRAALKGVDSDLFSIEGGPVTGFVAMATEKVVRSPVMRLSRSRLPVARLAAQKLFSTPLLRRGPTLGPSVESRIEAWNARGALAKLDVREQWVAYKKSGKTELGSFAEFRQATTRAIRRGNVDDVFEVQEAARRVSSHFGELADNAVAVGLIRADELTLSGTAAGWVHRRYLVDEIVERREEFEALVIDWLRANGSEVDDVQRTASGITDAILGHDRGLNPDTVVPDDAIPKLSEAGELRQRSLLIADEVLDAHGFLDNDIDGLIAGTTRTLGSRIEFRRAFPDGSVTEPLKGLRGEIEDEFTRLAKENPGRANALNDERQRTLATLDEAFRLLTGQTGQAAHASKTLGKLEGALRQFNFAVIGGGFLLSQAPDVAYHTLLGNSKGVFGGFGRMVSRATGRVRKTDLERMAVAAEVLGGANRARSFGDIADLDSLRSISGLTDVVYAASRGAASLTASLSGLNTWNRWMVDWGQLHSSHGIIDDALTLAKSGKLAARTRTRLRQAGITDELLERIAEQHAKHGETVDGLLHLPRSDRWDRDVARDFEAAVFSRLRSVVPKPSPTDLGAEFRTPWLRLGVQFMSFFVSTQQRVVIPAMQRADFAVFSSATFAMGLGALAFALRERVKGKELPDDWRVYASEGVNRSGVLGLFGEGAARIEGLTGYGLNAAIGRETYSRFDSRTVFDLALGASAGTLEAGYEVASVPFGGDVTSRDVRAARRLVPLQNGLLFRAAADEMERRTIENLPR